MLRWHVRSCVPRVQVFAMAYDRNPIFDQKQEFASRLARIGTGGLHTNRTLFIGVEEQLELPARVVPQRRTRRRGRALLLLLALLPGVCGAVWVATANLF